VGDAQSGDYWVGNAQFGNARAVQEEIARKIPTVFVLRSQPDAWAGPGSTQKHKQCRSCTNVLSHRRPGQVDYDDAQDDKDEDDFVGWDQERLASLAIDGKKPMIKEEEVPDPCAPRKTLNKWKRAALKKKVAVEVQTEEKEMKDVAVQTVEMAKVRPLTRTERRWVRRQKLAEHWATMGMC